MSLGVLHHKGRLTLFIGRVGNHPTREAGDFIDFFIERDAFLQILELHRAADLGENGVGVRIPLGQQLAQLYVLPVLHAKARAIYHLVTLLLTTTVIQDGHRTGAVHGYQRAVLALNVVQVDKAHKAVVLRIQARLVLHAAGCAAHVEGTHGELRSRLADGLRSNYAAGFAELDHAAGTKIAPVAQRANAASRFAGQHRADLHPLDTRALNCRSNIFIDALVHIHNDVAVVVLDALQRNTADYTVAKLFDDLARLDDRSDVDAFHRAAVVLGHDNVLRHVDQAPRQVAGVGCLQRCIGKALACAVRRDEVLEHGQPFAEVRRDGRLNDFARRLGHQSAHAAQLTNLLLRTAGAGVSHDVDRVHRAFIVGALHVPEHLVGHLIRNR